MLEKLHGIARSKTYWLALILLGIAQLAIALVYQHVWDELPCVLCIHVRLWVTCSVLLASVALLFRRHGLVIAGFHALNTVIMAGMFERSWQLLGTERGTIIAACDFDLGLPGWLALDKWFPAVFQAQTACGYTPELLFGITMAEGLVAISGVLVIVSATLTLVSLLRRT